MERTWEDQLATLYRNVFGTGQGQIVLANMLVDLHFFDTVEGEEVVLQNYARQLLDKIGVWRGENVARIVAGLMTIPIQGGEDGNEREP